MGIRDMFNKVHLEPGLNIFFFCDCRHAPVVLSVISRGEIN